MMKVFLSVAFAAILFAGNANAQHNVNKVAIGVKGGLNVYNIHNDGSTYDSKVGFNAGLLGHIHLVPHWALQPEIVYSAQGARGTGTGSPYKYSLDYINVPVLVQYMFDNGFRLEAGPQVGFLVNAKQKAGSNPGTDIKNNLKSTDIGLVAGISYVHPATGFGVDLRYNLGLSDINDVSTEGSKSTNRGAQFGVFYLFNHRY